MTEVLRKIEGTNRGIDCTPEQRQEIDRIIEQVRRPYLHAHKIPKHFMRLCRRSPPEHLPLWRRSRRP